MQIVKLTKAGVVRVLSGAVGMTFMVDHWGGVDDRCAMVRDYRYGDADGVFGRPFQIWTLAPGDFELIE